LFLRERPAYTTSSDVQPACRSGKRVPYTWIAQKPTSYATAAGISAVQMTPDHPFGNASATAVWEAAPVMAIDKQYGREHGHEVTLAAHLR
jgi:hypothetical protein